MKGPSPLARLVIGAVIVLAGWIQVSRAASGTRTLRLEHQGVPMLLMLPALDQEAPVDPAELEAGDEPEPVVRRRHPAVVVAHGFAASKQLMLGYGIALARSGHAVLLPDLSGHGDNLTPFSREAAARDLELAWEILARQPEVDRSRTALLGHSMGAGLVMQAALEHPERYRAVVAISPVNADVTPSTPRNLMLQAGTWEPRFLDNARELLDAAGGEGGEPDRGTGRRLVVVDRADHLGILFRPASQQPARRWIADALDTEEETEAVVAGDFVDTRPLWYLVQVLGWVVILSATVPIAGAARRPPPWELRAGVVWGAMVAALPVAAVVMAAIDRLVAVSAIGGLVVGGALSLWLLVGGTSAMVGASVPGRPRPNDLFVGAALFAVLWIIIGPLGQQVWIDWGLAGRRLWLWPLLGAAGVPWFALVGALLREASTGARVAAWAAQSVGFVAGGLLLARLVPSLGLVTILVPLMPPLLALFVYAGTRFDRPWAFGIGCGALWGWLIAAGFPLL